IVPVDSANKVNLEAVKAAITPNTILLVGSAFNYPKGVIDPISDLAALAEEAQIGMHVDACLG
ncbi:MAG TPA: aminotransferase class V-fold PLP-dependent enzyme, partial [Candidatus Lokiarchaeia archaeon]|nr:aminotransferase class V-fold PLP-dependent enzyme [Candidatus Lokiarchaeia archaeon]